MHVHSRWELLGYACFRSPVLHQTRTAKPLCTERIRTTLRERAQSDYDKPDYRSVVLNMDGESVLHVRDIFARDRRTGSILYASDE